MQTDFAISVQLSRPRGNPPEDWLADVELRFEQGALAGMILVGITILRGSPEAIVSMPKRVYTEGRGVKREFVFFRGADSPEGRSAETQFKGLVLAAFYEARSKAG